MSDHAGHNNRDAASDAGQPSTKQRAWEEYFPIQASEEYYVARRDFTKFLGLTSLGFVVGQFWIVVQNWYRTQGAAAAGLAPHGTRICLNCAKGTRWVSIIRGKTTIAC